MVDFSDTRDRCILHVEGDVNDADYAELTIDNIYGHCEESEFIAIYKYLLFYKENKSDDYCFPDLRYEDDENEEFADKLEAILYKYFIDNGLDDQRARDLADSMYTYIPNIESRLVHTITKVKLYKFENNKFYWYDNTEWKNIL